MQVTFDDCCRDLLLPGTDKAEAKLKAWQSNAYYREVVPFVENFSHRYLYELTPAAIQDVIERTNHALGNVRKEEKLSFIEDYHTPFALQHLFHWYVEEKKALPTWTEFRNWMVKDKAAPHWHQRLLTEIGPNPSDEKRMQWVRAARWRLGNFYQSTIRELDLFVRLRTSGLDIRYHLLADVLFRADFWANNVIVCLYRPNSKYREGKDVGRKQSCESLFDSANPPFKFVHAEVERQGFGKIWLATDKTVENIRTLVLENA